MKIKMLMSCLLLMAGLLIGLAAPTQAAYEVSSSSVNFSQTVTASQFVQVAADLTVSWTKPTDTSNVIMYYYLKFNTAKDALTGQQIQTGTEGTDYFRVSKDLDNKTIAKSYFDSWDSNQIRYLHIITQYVTTADPYYAFSSDVVVENIKIDNTAPTGTISLSPTSGSSSQVTVNISAASETKYFYLNDAATFPGGTGTDYSLFQSGVVNLRSGTSYGTVRIYAWFEDAAGNRSTAASATADYTYTAPVSIQCGSSSINKGSNLGCTVDQSTKYTWTITDASPSDVASFSGSSTDVASVTIVGNKAGTFTVTAGSLKTSTITVVETSTSKQYNLVTGLNIISLSRSGTGWAKAADVASAVGSTCQSIVKWDASQQGFVAHIKGTPLNNFTLVEGDAYFVNVTGASTFTVTGQTVTRTFSLSSGLNLVGLPEAKSSLTKAANLASDVGANVQSIIKWDASQQGFVAHIKGTPLNNYDISVGEGYFINVNATTQWQ